MINQFHEFFSLIFGGFLQFGITVHHRQDFTKLSEAVLHA